MKTDKVRSSVTSDLSIKFLSERLNNNHNQKLSQEIAEQKHLFLEVVQEVISSFSAPDFLIVFYIIVVFPYRFEFKCVSEETKKCLGKNENEEIEQL